MSNDTAECGCEGHVSNFDDCRYPALKARVAVLEEENSLRQNIIDAEARKMSAAQQHISDLEKSLENARSERDRISAAYTDVIRERSTYLKVTKERDAALADNAALLDRIGDGAAIACEEAGPEDCGKCGTCLDRSIMRQPHPGAALLEEHREALTAEGARAFVAGRESRDDEVRALLERVKRLEEELENARPFEALHADLSEQLRAAWDATGVSGTVKGMTTLSDVVGVQRADLLAAQERADAAEKVLSELADIIRAHAAKRKRESH